LKEFGDGLGSGVDVQHFVDAPDVDANGDKAEAQMAGNFLDQMPFGQQRQHFNFPD
jgi:cyanate lyase